MALGDIHWGTRRSRNICLALWRSNCARTPALYTRITFPLRLSNRYQRFWPQRFRTTGSPAFREGALDPSTNAACAWWDLCAFDLPDPTGNTGASANLSLPHRGCGIVPYMFKLLKNNCDTRDGAIPLVLWDIVVECGVEQGSRTGRPGTKIVDWPRFRWTQGSLAHVKLFKLLNFDVISRIIANDIYVLVEPLN